MVEVVAAASLISSAGGAAATAAGGSFLGLSAGTFAAIGGVASAASTVLGGIEQRNLSKLEAAQTRLEIAGEETQAARDEAERLRRLRRTLASQRALFGGSADAGGTPFTLGAEAISETNRQNNDARRLTNINSSQGRLQVAQTRSAGRSAFRNSLIRAGRTVAETDFGNLGSK